MQLFDIFRTGAMALATPLMKYSSVHSDYGINGDDWALLTSEELWTTAQRQRIRSILSEVVNISMTIAGIPAQPLPSQYVAAVITITVSPPNRIVACSCAPETFDGELSSGLLGKVEVRNVPISTMISLVVAYSSKSYVEPLADRIDKSIEDQSVSLLSDTTDPKKRKGGKVK